VPSSEQLVVITGGTRGLGLEIARVALQAVYRAIVIGRTPSEALTQLLSDSKGRLAYEPFDLENVAAIHELTRDLFKKHGRPWALVNNAAIGQQSVLGTLHESEVTRLLRINLEAPILFTKYASRAMLLERAGRIVNITSIIASTGFKGLTVYGATKAGLASFTRSLARELGPAGITVNNVAPGYMKTEMTSGLNEEMLETIQRRSPLNRLALPSEVAAAVLYLIGADAASVTGSTITVDAGSTA
jgi:3-oxoacyl-[acyl-carrier protein] reductase